PLHHSHTAVLGLIHQNQIRLPNSLVSGTGGLFLRLARAIALIAALTDAPPDQLYSVEQHSQYLLFPSAYS
ncbi:hypothetical protein FWK35_00021228, partial [Aphis craccivora]